ncbi:hypothetical protein EDD63_14016 [Breznakia blatticola]|uniref:MazG-like nucleotide pyrophosphohydrolase family protein n=1 Tax=Breznakia blatticola TaxID=1754012 RepID=A0A4R7ZAP9_9FIRM|nr:NTP pyrophosphatase (non-canonical NTP hydrolase) [Breznakia sp. PH1-1]MDH6404446.1 NTP pyrophosphatase (non-canonical NTP hydrolase) [Breznakia sp. PF1-11]MDH6412163.1 NTP pyrophosphatase (non-canonical NTP hydrolase) [Breznakia sp. PFB1-11]MDH6414434.1 NTP pyrophosphatase (non-canonical NTP hydrolase) [Breznakia sp. PFB1-14]MDH6416819.1 NTP pyrophosphatase (non-canonical NTP hydrolase) [Breznakia sp. PFB1-4]MDH6419188.1 NTP pyrophosphatase (non-canonical NTP hydrolase) [Breznakia sp. PFB1
MNRNEILKLAIKTWGVDAQTNCAMEELAELIQAISKFKRGYDNKEDIIDEIVDVQIMIDQIKLICDIDDTMLEKRATYKLQRIKNRLEE